MKDIKDARDKAFQYEKNLYGGNIGYTVGDAFRHSIWNALIAKYAGDYKNKISKCVDWAKTFTDKHEQGSVKPQNLSSEQFAFDQGMDYHNNKIGRDYFQSVAWTDKRKWYQPTRVKAPSENDMANAIFDKTKVSKLVGSKSEIDLYPGFLVHIVN